MKFIFTTYKFIRHISITCCLAAIGLMSVACQSDVSEEPSRQMDDDMVEITFKLESDEEALSRATDEDDVIFHIGKGSKINELIYAVYLDEVYESSYVDDQGVTVTLKDHVYTLLTQYGNNGHGQCVVDFPEGFTKYSLPLRLKKNQEYALVFWLQNKEAKAYDTEDFQCVKVNYDNAKNNDETRDVFAKVENLSVGSVQLTSDRVVSLSRPLVQINVGTTGKDYEGYITSGGDSEISSTVTLHGLARFMDVLRDRILTSDDYEEYAALEDPQTSPYHLIFKDLTSKDDMFVNNVVFSPSPVSNLYLSGVEEYLKVKLNHDNTAALKITGVTDKYPEDGYLDYKTTGDMKDSTGELFLTETFKYLSMCYVLVPAPVFMAPDYNTSGSDDDGRETSDNWGTLDGMVFTLYDSSGAIVGLKTINALPVRRNWRSNILGGLEETSSVFTVEPLNVNRKTRKNNSTLEINQSLIN